MATSRSVTRRKAVQRKAKKAPPKQRAAPVPQRHKLLVREPYTIEDGVTFSLQSSFGDCRQRCRWYLDGWRQPVLKESLEFGSLIHGPLLETLGKGVQSGAVATVEQAKALLPAHVDAWRRERAGAADSAELQQTEFVLAKAQAVWPAYCEVHKNDLRKSLWLDVEGTFDVRWRGYRLRGRRDGIRRDKRGRLWLFETKTKSQISDDDIMRTLSFDAQSLFYLVSNRAELERDGRLGKGIIGVVYNVVRNPGERRLKKGTEPLADYSARVAEKVAADPGHYFKRYEAVYTRDQVTAFEERLESKLAAFHAWLLGNAPTYCNEAACVKKWNCGFLDACASGGPERAGMIREGRLFEELEG